MPIKVAITDDHPMIVEGLEAMFSRYEHVAITGTYCDGEELLAGLVQHIPDVLLLDIQLPGKPGDELVPALLEQYPDMKILIFTNFDSNMYASKLVWQGVHGYLLKNTKEDDLIKIIERVYSGERFIDQGIMQKLDTESLRSRHIFTARSALSLREKEVLQLIVNGLTDQEIAGNLFLGLSTIKFYRKSILLKMDAKNTADMVSKALRLGLAR